MDDLLDEMELLEAMFPDEMEISPGSQEALAVIRKYIHIEKKAPFSSALAFKSIQMTFRFRVVDPDSQREHIVVVLCSRSIQNALQRTLQLQSRMLSRQARSEAHSRMSSMSTLVECLQYLLEALPDLLDWNETHPPESSHDQGAPDNDLEDSFASAYLLSHHIYSQQKRKQCKKWADELLLFGFLSTGKPGIIVIEGLAPNVDEFISLVKSMRWQRIAVKFEESSSERRLPKGFIELDGIDAAQAYLTGLRLQQQFTRMIGLPS